MSATKRPEWMPSVFAVERLVGGIAELEPFVSEEMRRTGLRAQIDALEELIAHMRARFTSASNPTGSYCNEESLWIAAKIAALRKELE